MRFLTKADMARFENVPVTNNDVSNFYYSFIFLPSEERFAINSLYSFCSYIDDIVDETPSDCSDSINRKQERLNWWENQIEEIFEGNVDNPNISQLVFVIQRYNLSKQYFLTLIDGCRRDLIQFRYSTFDELKDYCFGVASSVGLMTIEIFSHKYEETKNYAINLGYALQLTNILRDIKADKDRGYIYLPLEDLQRFNYTEEELINEVYDDRFVELMRFQAKRIREFYHKARTALHPDERSTITPAEIMDSIYYRLLDKIELKEFNVFQNRIRVSNSHKIMIALKHWLSIKVFVKRIKKPL